MRDFQNGCDICIATPGRLIDFISRKVTSLNRCSFLVVDEADMTLEFGFLEDIDAICSRMAFIRISGICIHHSKLMATSVQ